MISALLLLAAHPRLALRVTTPATRLVRLPPRPVRPGRSWAVRAVLTWRFR